MWVELNWEAKEDNFVFRDRQTGKDVSVLKKIGCFRDTVEWLIK